MGSATVIRLKDANRVNFTGKTIVGRSPICGLRTGHAASSAEHAVLECRPGSSCLVRDLGSRNGTLLNSDYLLPSEARPCHVGHTLIFGDESEAWRIGRLISPDAVVRGGRTASAIPIAREGTVLPSGDGIVRTVRHEDGVGWVLATGQQRTPLNVDSPFRVGDDLWTLSCDGPQPSLR
ncbi:MAG: FHA domain-containing protein [Myxococcales bacterium]|nr:FHA domain-containing protein [Myxococcales bacterium]